LEIDDVGLHEHRAAVAEHGHGRSREGQVGIFFHFQAEAFGGRLQEIAVAGRTLGVQLEILYTAVLQHNELDVLAADVHDDVRVIVELHGGFGVGHGLNQRYISVQDVLENI